MLTADQRDILLAGYGSDLGSRIVAEMDELEAAPGSARAAAFHERMGRHRAAIVREARYSRDALNNFLRMFGEEPGADEVRTVPVSFGYLAAATNHLIAANEANEATGRVLVALVEED